MKWYGSGEAIERLRLIRGEKDDSLLPGGERNRVSRKDPWMKFLPRRVQQDLIYAGVSFSELRSFLVLLLVGVILSMIVLLFAGARILTFITPALACGIGYSWVKRKTFIRAESFEKDYPVFLLSLAASVKTGQDPLIALLQSTELFPQKSELRAELEQLRTKIEKGATEESALTSFGETIDHPDIRLFRTVFVLSRKQGSSLSESLQRLAKVTRNRQSFRRKTRSAVAMQKLSSIGIAACAGLITVIQLITNPDALREAVAHPVGIKILGVGVLLIIGGMAWMLRMTRGRI